MVCYFPLKGWRSRVTNISGKSSITFNRALAYIDKPVEVPCGQCIGCRLERSRMWAIRCVHEASMHEQNCFITLTYDDAHLDKSGSLVPRDFVLFMKKLRKHYSNQRIRYFHCGEYGEKFQRPHHHACIFGLDFGDKYLWSTRGDVQLFRSSTLENLWGKGYCTIGEVTFDSAAYVARYVMKKITGDRAAVHYRTGFDLETGEVFLRVPEYITMSRRPGIARDWFEKYGMSDVYPEGVVTLKHKLKVKAPRYYDNLYDVVDPNGLENLKIERKIKASLRKEDNSSSRLEVRHECQVSRNKQLIRSFENDK